VSPPVERKWDRLRPLLKDDQSVFLLRKRQRGVLKAVGVRRTEKRDKEPKAKSADEGLDFSSKSGVGRGPERKPSKKLQGSAE